MGGIDFHFFESTDVVRHHGRVLYMLDGMGIETGVDMNALLDAAEFICTHLDRPTVSRAGRALALRRRKAA